MNLIKHISINPWPYACKAAAVLRDDDISYFTPPSMIERIYAKAWKQGFKVSLGVIPRVRAIDRKHIPLKYRGKLTFHNICNNYELVEFLKEKLRIGQIDIAQHGYTHEKICGKSEFCINNLSEIESRLKFGRKVVEECLQRKISVFIPPWDEVSKEAWKIIQQEGVALCRRGGLRVLVNDTSWSLSKIKAMVNVFIGEHLKKIPFSGGIVKISNLLEIWYSLGIPSGLNESNALDTLKGASETFMKIHKHGGLFCLLNHYWDQFIDWGNEIKPKRLSLLYDLLNLLDLGNTWKTTLTEAVRWIENLKNVQFKIKNDRVIIKPLTDIYGLSIRGKDYSLIPPKDYETTISKERNVTYLTFEKINREKTILIEILKER